MWRRWVAVLAIAGAIMSGVLAIEVANPPEQPRQQQHAKNSEKESSHDDQFYRFWEWSTHDPVAFFTFMLAIFTGALVVVSSIQIRFLIRADNTTRISAEAAKSAALAAIEQVEIGRQQADFAERSVKDIQRAYIFVKELVPVGIIETLSPVGLRGRYPVPQARVVLRNYGKSPANIRAAGILVEICDDIPTEWSPPSGEMGDGGLAIEMIIGEGDETDFGFPIGSHEARFTGENIERIKKGETFIFCHGWIKYIDIFMHEHELVFCRKYLHSTGKFWIAGGYNRNHGN